MLHVKLFGTPQVSLNDHLVTPPLVGKELALFAYLVTNLEPCLRTFLTDLLWTELPADNARMNFRTALYNLRRALGDYLVITRETVALNRRLPYWADVEIFGRAAARDRALLAAALPLYLPDFLDGLTVPNASAFDGWLVRERQHLHSQAIMGWQQLVQTHWQAQQYEEGLAANNRLLALEPWNEAAHQQQMRLLAATGQRQVALLHYERCCQILREEVDAPPSPETTALYEQIKAQASVYPPVAPPPPVTQPPVTQPPAVSIDWGSMPHQPHFYGRSEELATLQQWIVAERCRVVAIIGIAGQGKTALTAHFARSLIEPSAATAPFDGIIWRSLLQAPPLTALLQDWLYQLSDQQLVTLPPTLDRQFALLVEYLQKRRFLLVLDNAEALVEAGADKSAECAAYRQLWQLLQERTHRSCLVVMARTLPASINQQQEQAGIFRRLLLEGLTASAGAQVLKHYGLQGNVAALSDLQQRYSGNPLALTLMARTIDELFAGDVDTFLQEDLLFFGDIAAFLDQQWARLSPLQQELLTWLALEQEPITYEQLWRNLAPSPTKSDYITAIGGLLQRALIQQQGAALRVQTVILEYTRHRLLETCYQELIDDKVTGWQGDKVTGWQGEGMTGWQGDKVTGWQDDKVTRWQGDKVTNAPLSPPHLVTLSPHHPLTLSNLNRYALRKAQAKEYIAASQTRLLIAPLLRRLLAYWGRSGLEKVIHRWLAALRGAYAVGAPVPAGYAAANLWHLLLQLDEEVQGYDFSRLTLRQATLRNPRLHKVDLSGATLQECTFTAAFAAASALACHPTGQWLAVGAVDGAIHLWRLGEDHFYGQLAGHTARITALAVSPDGRWLASSSVDCQIYLWDMETHTLSQRWPAAVHAVGGLAFSPDGQWLAVPGADGVVKLYDVTTGALAYTLASSSAQLWSVAFSPNGQWVAGGSAEGDLYLWAVTELSAASAQPPHQQIHGHADGVAALLFSRDSRTLYSGGWDHLIHRWDVTPLASGRLCPTEPMNTLTGHSQPVRGLTLSATGQWLASGSADGTVRVWDSQSGALLETLHGQETHGHEMQVWAVAFQPPAPGQQTGGTQLLVSAGSDQRLCTWEIEAQPRAQAPTCRGRLRQVLQGYVDAQRGVAFLPTGSMLISAGDDKTVRLWDRQKGTLHATLCRQASGIQNLTISPNGQTLAWSDVDGKLWLWSALRKAGSQKHGSPCDQPPALLAGHTLPIYGLAFHPQGQILVSASHDQTIRLWDVATGQLLHTVRDHSCPVWAVAFSPDGETLVSAGQDGAIQIWALPAFSTTSGATLHRVQTLTGHSACVRQVAFTPDGEWLVSSANDQTLRLWDRNYQPRQVLTGHTGNVQALAVSPCRLDGRLTVASCDQHQQLRIWDCERGEVIHAWAEPEGEIHQLTYSPDGKTLAGANRDGYLRLWDVQTGSILSTIQMPKPYSGANITGVTGITAAQKQTLRRLGAVDEVPTAETHTPAFLS